MSDTRLIPSLSSDRPVKALCDDLLARGEYVIAMANAFIQWKADESLVVALYGPWGAGKSSIKNMIVDVIQKHEPKPAIVEFNPWSWSGSEQIQSAFFSEIGRAIGKQSPSPEAKAAAAKWGKYASRITLAGSVLNAIKLGTHAFGIPLIPAVVEGLTKGTEQASQVAEAKEKLHTVSEAEETIEDLKQSLSDTLQKLEVPVLVVMDDVDRLTNEEVRLLFQLIKVNADFPRLIYLVLFDRGIVERALDGFGGASGRDYLEKIVQAGFDLPETRRSDLDKIFLAGLDCLLNFEGATRTFDQDRWWKLYHHGLKPILKTPRDVRRFLSALSFTVGLFYRNNTLEVNPIDLIGIEGLRVFEPNLYSELRRRKDLLLGESGLSLLGRDERANQQRDLESLLAKASEEHRDGATSILSELFPVIEWGLKGHVRGQGFEKGWLRDLRICHKDLFSRYFALTVPEGDIPQASLDQLIKLMADREALVAAFLELNRKDLLGQTLGRLEAYFAEIDVGNAACLVTSLMDVGDQLPQKEPGIFDIGPNLTAYFLIYHFMLTIQDKRIRGDILIRAIEETQGLSLPVDVVSFDNDRREVNHATETLFSDDDLIRAKSLCTKKIVTAASEGRLLGPRFLNYLFRWRDFDGETAPRNFVAELCRSIEGTLQFLRAATQQTEAKIVGLPSVERQWIIQRKNIDPFVDFSLLQKSLAPLLGSAPPSEFVGFASEYNHEIEAFRKAIKQP